MNGLPGVETSEKGNLGFRTGRRELKLSSQRENIRVNFSGNGESDHNL